MFIARLKATFYDSPQLTIDHRVIWGLAIFCLSGFVFSQIGIFLFVTPVIDENTRFCTVDRQVWGCGLVTLSDAAMGFICAGLFTSRLYRIAKSQNSENRLELEKLIVKFFVLSWTAVIASIIFVFVFSGIYPVLINVGSVDIGGLACHFSTQDNCKQIAHFQTIKRCQMSSSQWPQI